MDWDALLIKARTLPGFRDDPRTPEWIDAQLALHPYPPDFVEFARAGFAGVTVSLSNIVLRPLDALHDEATDLYGALPDFGMVMVGMDGGGNAVVWNHAHRRLALVDHGFTTHGISKQGDQWCDEDGEPVDLVAEARPMSVFFWGKSSSPMSAAPELRPRVTPTTFAELVEAGIESILLREGKPEPS